MKSTNAPLADDRGLGSVSICECGSINVSVGLATLHLAPGAFLRAAALMQLAAERYLKQNDPAQSASDLSPSLASAPSRFIN